MILDSTEVGRKLSMWLLFMFKDFPESRAGFIVSYKHRAKNEYGTATLMPDRV